MKNFNNSTSQQLNNLASQPLNNSTSDGYAIRVEHLSKRYRIGMDRTYKTFCESAVNAFKSPVKTMTNLRKQNDTFWALKDVNFEVNRGEVVGIIGRNGAGKSTLLKILSRITHPTEGEVILKGRVGSLLEVGTGFHPELTGRENVYFNGAILGMKKKEIEDKFDEIVEFSGVEKFLDTPLKRYSSGMQVRLAFSVAAHLDPEILLVDEVLAVGDAAFQKKCLGKMKDVATGGRTVLFVSHNMEAIRRLCPRAVLIADGHIQLDGNSEDIVSAYLSHGREQTPGVRDYDGPTAPGDDYVRLRSIRLVNEVGNLASVFRINEGLSADIVFTVLQPIFEFHTHLRVFTQDGVLVFGTGSWDEKSAGNSQLLPGRYIARCVIPGNLLNRGFYYLTVTGAVPNVRYIFMEENVLGFEIIELGGAGGLIGFRPGIIRPIIKWNISKLRETKSP